MAYKIEYYRETVLVGSVPWSGTLPETITVAEGGMVRNSCDFARIIDVDGSGAEVWSGRRNANGT